MTIVDEMGTDGVRWAEGFYSTLQEHPEMTNDLGSLTGWFANAIEAGRSAGRRETCPHDWLTLAPDLVICRVCGKPQEQVPA